jgi:hypothetical protein
VKEGEIYKNQKVVAQLIVVSLLVVLGIILFCLYHVRQLSNNSGRANSITGSSVSSKDKLVNTITPTATQNNTSLSNPPKSSASEGLPPGGIDVTNEPDHF